MYTHITDKIKTSAPIVFAREADDLEHHLARAGAGQSFILLGGDCAETFEDSTVDKLWLDFVLLLHASLLLSYGMGIPVVKIGRLAGQYAKPRSTLLETRETTTLPAYQGDIINNPSFTQEARVPDPYRMWRAYCLSVQSMNILRAFIQGGYTSIQNFRSWMHKLNITSTEHDLPLHTSLDKALAFVSTLGLPKALAPDASFYIGHEALLLPYEECLVRRDSISSRMYGCSAHFLWIGERTRELDGAHVEFLRGVANPIGVKVSSSMTPDELLQLTHILNPTNRPGRLTLITRMGAAQLETHLPPLILCLQQHSRHVVWMCDPMHANTFHIDGKKVRYIDDIFEEIAEFFRIHKEHNSIPAGIHLELTGQSVSECRGGLLTWSTKRDDVPSPTAMDPRLNPYQVIELILRLVQLIHGH